MDWLFKCCGRRSPESANCRGCQVYTIDKKAFSRFLGLFKWSFGLNPIALITYQRPPITKYKSLCF